MEKLDMPKKERTFCDVCGGELTDGLRGCENMNAAFDNEEWGNVYYFFAGVDPSKFNRTLMGVALYNDKTGKLYDFYMASPKAAIRRGDLPEYIKDYFKEGMEISPPYENEEDMKHLLTTFANSMSMLSWDFYGARSLCWHGFISSYKKYILTE